MQGVDGHALVACRGGDGHHLLGEHVERVARHDRLLDQPLAHAVGDHGALEQVGAELGEDAPVRDLADAVAGAADALQPAGHRLGRLDLHDEVDGPHVDAELERRGRHQAGQLAGLELVLDDEALLARQRAVVGTGDLARGAAARVGGTGCELAAREPAALFPAPDGLAALRVVARREVVQAQGDALGGAPVVDEDEGRAVLAHELEQLGVDRRPDRAARGLAARHAVELDRHVGLDHRLDRHVDAQVERLAHAGVDDGALAATGPPESGRPRRAGAAWPRGRCAARRDRPARPGVQA